DASKAAYPPYVLQPRIRVDFGVGDRQHLAGSRNGKVVADRPWVAGSHRLVTVTVYRRERRKVNGAIDKAENRGGEAVDQPVRAFGNRLEHRLHVVGRTGDHLEDVGRRGLPLQRFLGLVEQTHVLDGDHGLVGEGLQQLDVVVRELTRLNARHADHSNGLLVERRWLKKDTGPAARPSLVLCGRRTGVQMLPIAS